MINTVSPKPAFCYSLKSRTAVTNKGNVWADQWPHHVSANRSWIHVGPIQGLDTRLQRGRILTPALPLQLNARGQTFWANEAVIYQGNRTRCFTIRGDNPSPKPIRPGVLKRNFVSQGVEEKSPEKYRFNFETKEYPGHLISLLE